MNFHAKNNILSKLEMNVARFARNIVNIFAPLMK